MTATTLAAASTLRPVPFLRRVLRADAFVSAASGALMVLGAAPLGPWLGLPRPLLTLAGLALFPYAAYLLWLARRDASGRAALWLPIVANLAWAADCALVGAGAMGLAATLPGLLFLGMQAAAVLAFAALEYVGLRRSAH